jgi:hypothetical protein
MMPKAALKAVATPEPIANSCSTCVHWIKGECRRLPPHFAALGNGSYSTQTDRKGAWPITQRTDWCGEHKTNG